MLKFRGHCELLSVGCALRLQGSLHQLPACLLILARLLQCPLESALYLAASAENGSEHPLASAVLAHAAQRLECLGAGGAASGGGALPAELAGGPMEPGSSSEGGAGGEASHSTHEPLLAVRQVPQGCCRLKGGCSLRAAPPMPLLLPVCCSEHQAAAVLA